MVISASWISRIGEDDGTLNMRGVSTILALAGFLKRELSSLAGFFFFSTTI
jgi:glycosylphosphatidylinositol transamidase